MPMSCAYCVHWQGEVVGMLFTYRKKSSGLFLLPCGVPSSLTFSDKLVPVFKTKIPLYLSICSSLYLDGSVPQE